MQGGATGEVSLFSAGSDVVCMASRYEVTSSSDQVSQVW